MISYRLYIGLNDKDLKRQIIPTETAKKIVFKYVIDLLGYGTITTGKGIYTHENGAQVIENTIIIEYGTGTEREKDIEKLCKILKAELNQESILTTMQEVSSVWY